MEQTPPLTPMSPEEKKHHFLVYLFIALALVALVFIVIKNKHKMEQKPEGLPSLTDEQKSAILQRIHEANANPGPALSEKDKQAILERIDKNSTPSSESLSPEEKSAILQRIENSAN